MKSVFPLRSSLIFALLLQLVLLPCGCAEPTMPPGTKVLKDIPYVQNGHDKQKLDLYLPASPKGHLMVFIHGGAWRAGSKNNAEGLQLLALGFTVANIEYRFSQDAIFPAQIEDCKAAIRWLRKHAAEHGYDPNRIGAWGASAGGHLVALLATTGNMRDFDVGENLDQSSAIQCGVDVFGPADFPGWKPPTDHPMVQRTGSDSAVTQLLGGSVDENLELAKRASPITWVSKETAPLFIMHGTKDELVGVDQSINFAERLKTSGAQVTLEIVEGAGHGGGEFFSGDRPQRLLAFLQLHLTRP